MLRFVISIISISLTSVYADGYVNFVRQQQQASKIVWDMPVAPQGTAPASLITEEVGSLFQLWTVSQNDAKDYLLDQKLVGAYIPKGQIVVRSADSYNGIPRIRVDQPFSVEFTVSNLLSGPNMPVSATAVLAEHHLALNPDRSKEITVAQAISGTPYSSGYISENGVTTVNYPGSSIAITDPAMEAGEEHFVLHALGDEEFSQTQIAHAYINVWPMATGKISGIKSGELVRFTPPVLTVALEGLYPESSTFIRIRGKDAAPGEESSVLPGSMVTLDQEKPENRLLSVSDYGHLFEKDGYYEIELVTTTPFGTDVLDRITFRVNRILKINAMLVDGSSP